MIPVAKPNYNQLQGWRQRLTLALLCCGADRVSPRVWLVEARTVESASRSAIGRIQARGRGPSIPS